MQVPYESHTVVISGGVKGFPPISLRMVSNWWHPSAK